MPIIQHSRTNQHSPGSTGSSDDWAKGKAGIKYSYTVELRDKGSHGFLLPASQILPTGREMFAAVRAIARALAQAWFSTRGNLNCFAEVFIFHGKENPTFRSSLVFIPWIERSYVSIAYRNNTAGAMSSTSGSSIVLTFLTILHIII